MVRGCTGLDWIDVSLDYHHDYDYHHHHHYNYVIFIIVQYCN